jgi:ankyrin repeat protein
MLVAVRNNALKSLDELLRRGVKPDTTRKDGWTALMQAAKTGNLEAAQRLLAAGANPKINNHAAKNAVTIARDANHPNLAKLLETHRPTPPPQPPPQ